MRLFTSFSFKTVDPNSTTQNAFQILGRFVPRNHYSMKFDIYLSVILINRIVLHMKLTVFEFKGRRGHFEEISKTKYPNEKSHPLTPKPFVKNTCTHTA